jgi:hypothetical protein
VFLQCSTCDVVCFGGIVKATLGDVKSSVHYVAIDEREEKKFQRGKIGS